MKCNWFSSTHDGVTTFAIGRPTTKTDGVTVSAHLEYRTGTKVYAWTDVLVLDRAGDSWVLSDILFVDGSTLTGTLRAKIAEAEDYLRSYPK